MRAETFLLELNDIIQSGQAIEVPLGSNRGPLIDKILKTAGAALGSPWCASYLFYGAMETGLYKKSELPKNPAAVYQWYRFFDDRNLVTSDVRKVKRGDLGFWLDSKTKKGHIWAIVELKKVPIVSALFPKLGWWMRTQEGNANSEDGSREGIKALKKWRQVTAKTKFILFSEY